MIGALDRLGGATIRATREIGGMTLSVADAVAALLRGGVDGRELLRHVHRFAVAPLGLVLGGAVVTGGVVAMQGLSYIDRYSAGEVFGWAAGVSSFRDVGPLLLAFTLASRLGARNTAELSMMIAAERLAALQALGLDVRAVVLRPRLLAIAIAGVLLYPLATTTVMVSAFLFAQVVGGQLFTTSIWSMTEYMSARIVLQGLLRLAAFAAWIGVTSCWFGRRPGTDADAIGRAVFAQSVTSIGGIVVLNLYLELSQGTT